MTKEDCKKLLLHAYEALGRYPKKSDFTPEQVERIKAFFGPWPRALEACGILPDKSAERETAKKQKRIEKKRRETQRKIQQKMQQKKTDLK